MVPLLQPLLQRLLQVAQRLAACAEFFEKVAMLLVGDGRALRADVDRPGRPVIVPWKEAVTRETPTFNDGWMELFNAALHAVPFPAFSFLFPHEGCLRRYLYSTAVSAAAESIEAIVVRS